MKTSSKLMGVFLVLVLALTLVGFQTSAVTAGDQKWTKILNAQIGDAGRLLATANTLAYDVAPDGVNIWAAGGNGRQLYKSSNGGISFSSPKTVVAAGAAIVAVAISPDYATDKTIYVATAADLHRTTDDGNSWNPFSGAAAALGTSGTVLITSMDVAKDASGNTNIVIGTESTAVGGSLIGIRTSVTTAFNGLTAALNSITVNYINQAGVAAVTPAFTVPDNQGAVTPFLTPIPLAAGDTAVLDVTGATLTKPTSALYPGIRASVTTTFNGNASLNSVTVSYINQAGAAAVTPAFTIADNTAAVTPFLTPIPLAVGDTGVRDVTTITFTRDGASTSTAGVLAIETLAAGNASLGTVTFAPVFADGASVTSTAGVVTIETLLAGNASFGSVTFANVYADTGYTGFFGVGEVWVYKSDTGMWLDQNVARNTAPAFAANTTEVLMVAFSRNFPSDGVLFAFLSGDNRVSTLLNPARVVTKWSNFNNGTAALWGQNWFDTDSSIGNPFITGGTITSVSLAFPQDFDVINTGKNYYYAGVSDSSADPATGDVFRLTGRGPGSGFTFTEVRDLGLGADVNSVAFTGNITGGTLLVGLKNQSVVQRTTDVLSNTPTFTPAIKSPISQAAMPNIMVQAAATGANVWAASQGAESGFHRSTDGGAVFIGTSFIQTTIDAPGGITDFQVNPANQNEIIAVTQSTANGSSSTWITTNNGDNWARVWVDVTGVNTIDIVQLSPTYSTDKTYFLVNLGATRIWRTSDGGNTFAGVSAPLSAAGGGITAFAVETGTNLIVGYGNGEVQRSISSGLTWVKSVTGAGSATILDILVNPATKTEVYTANTSGQIHRSTDSTVTFRKTEHDVGAITNATLALADGYSSTVRTVFIATNTGIYRQQTATELRWIEISANNPTPVADNANGLAVYATETLAATSPTAGVGIFRSTNAQRLDANTNWARARYNDEAIAGVMTKLLRKVTTSASTTLFMVETSTGIDTIFKYTDLLSKRITLQLPRSKSGISDTDRLTFTWTGLTLPDGAVYRLVVAYDSGFDQQLGGNHDTEGTTFRLVDANFEPGRTYYWYVQGRYTDASTDVITSPRGRHLVGTAYVGGEFYTGVNKPALISPIGGALTGGVDAPLRPVLQWGSVEGANRYELQVDTSASFFAPFVNLTDTGRLDSTAYQIDKDLEYSTTYYWRVRSATFTALGDWSTVGAFTTMAKPVAAAPPIVVQQQPAPIINIPAPTTPSWVWVVIVIGAILVIVMLVLIVRTRRV